MPHCRFESSAAGWLEDPKDPNKLGDPEGRLVTVQSGISLLFIPVPEGKPDKPRTGLHLDLMPSDGTRDHEAERLVGLGATVVADDRKPDGTGWVTMADPEGNQFRVERRAAERVKAVLSSVWRAARRAPLRNTAPPSVWRPRANSPRPPAPQACARQADCVSGFISRPGEPRRSSPTSHPPTPDPQHRRVDRR